MMALAYLVAAGLYLALMFVVVRGAWRSGRANGGSRTKAFGFATAGFLLVYLLVFWNWIPVLLTHRSLCSKDAGFTAYVTPEQWVEQNRDQFSKLVGVDLDKTTRSEEVSPGVYRYQFFGGLLVRESRDEKNRHFGLDFWRSDSRVLDAKTGRLLTKRVNYTGGSPEEARLWLRIGSCSIGSEPSPLNQEMLFKSKLKEEIK